MTPATPVSTSSGLAIAAALAVVYVVWGSTYLAIHVAVAAIPPFLVAGTRFLVAGVLLYIISRWRGDARPRARAWAAAGLIGLVMFVVSHGLLAWASQFVPSGTAAVVSSASPAWIALGGATGVVAGHRPTFASVIGILLGLVGIIVAIDPVAFFQGTLHVPAMFALVGASIAWAIASVLMRWSALPRSATLTAAMAMMTGGAMLLALSLALREPGAIRSGSVGSAAWGALAYLTFVGSLLAYTCYVWLIKVDGPARVSTHSFVNPVVAVLLGALFMGEPLTRSTLFASVLVVMGVVLINVAPRVSAARARRLLERATATPPSGCHGC